MGQSPPLPYGSQRLSLPKLSNSLTGWCNVNFLRSSKMLGQQCRLCGLKACCCVVVSGRLRRSAKRILRLTHAPVTILINRSINFYLLKMSRDTHKRLFNCEQDNKAETSTNSCPTNKLYYERKGKNSTRTK